MLYEVITLIAMKRAGELGPRELGRVKVEADDARELITLETAATLTVLNFSGEAQSYPASAGWMQVLSSNEANADGQLVPYSAVIYKRR